MCEPLSHSSQPHESSISAQPTIEQGGLLIQSLQVWLPDDRQQQLHLQSAALTTPRPHLTDDHKPAPLTCGQGIAGRAWQQRCATLLQEEPSQLLSEYSQQFRTPVKAVLAIPIFRQQQICGVVVLGLNEGYGGAEIWCRDDRDELAVSAGHYAGLPAFEFISRHTRFPKGAGVPGRVWRTAQPLIASNLAADADFVRSFGNDPATVTSVVGIPIDTDHGFARSVLLLLYAQQNPWCNALTLLPCETDDEGTVRLSDKDLQSIDTPAHIDNSVSAITDQRSQFGALIREVGQQQAPVLLSANQPAGVVLGMPVYVGATLHSVLSFQFHRTM
jgi:hypothetical protein